MAGEKERWHVRYSIQRLRVNQSSYIKPVKVNYLSKRTSLCRCETKKCQPEAHAFVNHHTATQLKVIKLFGSDFFK
jgi:hypothetical protein